MWFPVKLISSRNYLIVFFTRDGLGVFSMCLDADFQPIVKYGACTFQNKETQAYLYRAKYGNWVVGKSTEKNKNSLQI